MNFSFDRFGMHEDYSYYKDCKYRNRNKGLFTADQVLNYFKRIETLLFHGHLCCMDTSVRHLSEADTSIKWAPH